MTEDIKSPGELWALAIGLVLRNARETNGLVQADLAYRAGMSGQTLHRLENGKTNLSLGTLVSVCSALEMSPATAMQRAQELVESSKNLRAALAERTITPRTRGGEST